MLKILLKLNISNKALKFATYSTNTQILIKNQTINYVKTGHGPKPIFLSPGAFGSAWTDFKPQLEQLDKTQFTIIAWDPPGYGSSRPPDRKASLNYLENDADFAYELIKSLGIGKISLLGWSDGGMFSLVLAAKHPEIVEKLVVWGVKAYSTLEELEYCYQLKDKKYWNHYLIAPLIEMYTKDVFLKMWDEWYEVIRKQYHENNGEICRSFLSQIQCPTLILQGDKDPLISFEHGNYLKSHIKNSKLHRFPEGKHMLHYKYEKKFNEIVTKFLLDIK